MSNSAQVVEYKVIGNFTNKYAIGVPVSTRVLVTDLESAVSIG